MGVAVTLLTISSHVMAAELVEMPPRAPRAAVTQDVGLTRISVDYRSPAVRGRPLWGASVPLGQPWRTGDSPQATIAVDHDVTVAGRTLAAGTYALVATPDEKTWTFTFEPLNPSPAGTTEQAVVRIAVPVERASARERLRFAFSTFTTSSAELALEWEQVRLSLPIAVDTSGQILSAIAALDRHDADLGGDYERAARVLLDKKGNPTDRDKGRAFLERAKALAESPGDPSLRQKVGTEPTAGQERVGAVADRGLVSASAVAPLSLPASSERSAPAAVRATRAPGANEIGPVVTKGRPAIQACYQRALRRDPTLAGGRINVAIAIGVSGRVKSVDVSGPDGLRAVEACVKSAVATWAFPPAPDAYATEVPLVLDRHD